MPMEPPDYPAGQPMPPPMPRTSGYVDELINRLETAHRFAAAHLAECADVLAKLRTEASR